MHAIVNGYDVPLAQGQIGIEDRGLLFADAVYEVVCVEEGCLIDLAFHMERLERCLHDLQILLPMPMKALEIMMKDFIRRRKINSSLIYLQISRGSTTRRHALQNERIKPNWFMWSQPTVFPKSLQTLSVRSVEDPRWKRVDIKTVNLLPNCLARQNAWQDGYDDVWFHDSAGQFREASSANIWIIKENRIITPDLDGRILPGTVRRVLTRIIDSDSGLVLCQQPFVLNDVIEADEAFQTGTGIKVSSVVKINGIPIADGKPGRITTLLAKKYKSMSQKTADN